MIDTMMEALHRAKAVPRPEYPRPQMVREKWMNLNGRWQFEMDPGCSGRERGLPDAKKLQDAILVPFCPESRLSGIGKTDFMPSVWYRRTFTVPQDWAGDQVLLHFGAVDYEAVVWINGIEVGAHRGGYTPFTLNITNVLNPEENVVTLWAKDDTRSGAQRSGKQSMHYDSYGCFYTRTTGIWQTVWLEAVPALSIASVKLDPDLPACAVHLLVALSRHQEAEVEVEAYYEGASVGRALLPAAGGIARGTVALNECHPWAPGNGRLYDLVLTLRRNDQALDTVVTYAGLRSVTWGEGVIRINGKPVFQRLILDQGFYPDGIYTAPDDDALKGDIERSMAMGFNGARLHEKVFEPRFLYWADRLGYMVWSEHACWGLDIDRLDNLRTSLKEWTESVERDYSHPCVVGWCPYNETTRGNRSAVGGEPLQYQDDAVLRITYEVTKLMDPGRPVIDASGYVHVVTDIYDCHNYEQDVEAFIEQLQGIADGQPFRNEARREPLDAWHGQPYFVSEFGGIRWAPREAAGWGYGQAPQSEEEFVERYRGLVTWLLQNPKICAFCYTQLTDVEQEVNGLYTYDRRPKFDPAVIAGITAQKAAIEE